MSGRGQPWLLDTSLLEMSANATSAWQNASEVSQSLIFDPVSKSPDTQKGWLPFRFPFTSNQPTWLRTPKKPNKNTSDARRLPACSYLHAEMRGAARSPAVPAGTKKFILSVDTETEGKLPISGCSSERRTQWIHQHATQPTLSTRVLIVA